MPTNNARPEQLHLKLFGSSSEVMHVRTHDPFGQGLMVRLARSAWPQAPAVSGVYILWGFSESRPTIYCGMSTTSIHKRAEDHRAESEMGWASFLFAVPLEAAKCRIVEALMIDRANSSGVAIVRNKLSGGRAYLDSDDAEALGGSRIFRDLEMVLGYPVFTPQSLPQTGKPKSSVPHREKRRTGITSREGLPAGPAAATHVAVMGSLTAFGMQAASGSFVVLSGSQYRRSVPRPDGKPDRVRRRSARLQADLARLGLIDWKTGRFAVDHVFSSWGEATAAVCGWGVASGPVRWRTIV